MSSQLLKRLAGPALTLGGLLWVSAAISSVIVGMLTGKVNPFPDAHSPALVYIGVWIFPLGILPLGVGLLGVFARLEGRARVSGITGIVLASIGMIMGIGALISIFASNNNLDSFFGGLGSFAIIIGSGFLGLAALRAHALLRWLAITLLIFGFVTVPFVFVTPLPIGPAWATDFLGFFLIAIVYVVAGVTLMAGRKHADSNARAASIGLAAAAK
jgi:hypothetical protein